MFSARTILRLSASAAAVDGDFSEDVSSAGRTLERPRQLPGGAKALCFYIRWIEKLKIQLNEFVGKAFVRKR